MASTRVDGGGGTPTGTAFDAPDPAAWLGLAVALVAATQFGLADPIRYTLYAVILLVLLRNATALQPALDRFTRALS